jgi:hypothetical protein
MGVAASRCGEGDAGLEQRPHTRYYCASLW